MIEINVSKINKNYGFNKVLDNLSFTVKSIATVSSLIFNFLLIVFLLF